MRPVSIHLEGDGCWPDLRDKPINHGELREVAYLDHGMQSGLPSVMMRIEMDDGTVIMAETSARMFTTIAAAIKGKAQRDGIEL